MNCRHRTGKKPQTRRATIAQVSQDIIAISSTKAVPGETAGTGDVGNVAHKNGHPSLYRKDIPRSQTDIMRRRPGQIVLAVR
jgi:hypothetical protein